MAAERVFSCHFFNNQAAKSLALFLEVCYNEIGIFTLLKSCKGRMSSAVGSDSCVSCGTAPHWNIFRWISINCYGTDIPSRFD